MKQSSFALAAMLSIGIASCAGGGQTPYAGTGPDFQRAVTTEVAAPSAAEQLFVASADPYFVDDFALPMTNTSMPAHVLQNIDEPVPLAVDAQHLFVGSFDDGVIYRYHLPLSGSAMPQRISLGGLRTSSARGTFRAPLSGLGGGATGVLDIGVPSGIAVGNGFLYVAGAGNNGKEQVQAYATPVTSGAMPTATIQYDAIDFLGVATAGNALYIASTTEGTIRAFATPLHSGQTPLFTINIRPQQDAAIGITVGGKIYVTDYSTGEVLVFALPYHSDETPVRLNMRIANGGSNPFPYAVAVDREHLFVSASNGVYQYDLPITPKEMPSAVAPFSGSAAGVAAWPKWPQ